MKFLKFVWSELFGSTIASLITTICVLVVGAIFLLALGGCEKRPTQQLTAPTVHKVKGISMVPTIPTGAIVIASPFPYEQLALGDIVVFKDRRIGLVMHRLHAKVAGGWTTKGDGNDTIDHDAMTEWNYVGKVTLHVVP